MQIDSAMRTQFGVNIREDISDKTEENLHFERTKLNENYLRPVWHVVALALGFSSVHMQTHTFAQNPITKHDRQYN